MKLLQFWVPAHAKPLLFFSNQSWASIWWWMIYLTVVSSCLPSYLKGESYRCWWCTPDMLSVLSWEAQRQAVKSWRQIPCSLPEVSHTTCICRIRLIHVSGSGSSWQQEVVFSTLTLPASCPLAAVPSWTGHAVFSVLEGWVAMLGITAAFITKITVL